MHELNKLLLGTKTDDWDAEIEKWLARNYPKPSPFVGQQCINCSDLRPGKVIHVSYPQGNISVMDCAHCGKRIVPRPAKKTLAELIKSHLNSQSQCISVGMLENDIRSYFKSLVEGMPIIYQATSITYELPILAKEFKSALLAKMEEGV